ncbi:hypothetical protein [Microbacterium paludicola]|uniref:hypothetical protein n=1 Tax=Microbacterium paludicola TaxID=300019 RepID=UPI000A713B43|nr:hypothetical protein [Microbacterium paludicola]
MLKPTPLLTRYGSLTVMGVYRDRARRQTFVIALCDCGTLTRAIKANVLRGNTTSCGDQARHKRKQEREVTGYAGMHLRLYRHHGKASNYECRDCGRQGAEWSYLGDSPAELVEVVNGRPLAYSMRMRDYGIRCVSCHRLADGNPLSGAIYV